MAETTQTTQNPDWPFWLPGREEFELLPPGVKAALQQLVVPLYRQLVLDAADPLRKAVGFTLVHVTWLEILDAVELGREPAPSLPFLDLNDRKGKADAYLKLVAAKMRAANFLLRLEQFRRGLGRRAATPPVGQVRNLSPGPVAENADSVDKNGKREEGRGKRAEGRGQREDRKESFPETGRFVDKKSSAWDILPAEYEDLSLVEAFRLARRQAEAALLRKNDDPVDKKPARQRRRAKRKARARARSPK